jgi:hypothetical protein
MAGDASDLATLGLEPGADRDAIERAYRRLIKDHHPDRGGGDGVRATEIIRAYRALRGSREAPDGLEFYPPLPSVPDRLGQAWLPAVLLLGVASLTLVLMVARSAGPIEQGLDQSNAQRGTIELMQRPIDAASVRAGVGDAVRIARSGDEMALTEASRDCHSRLRDAPSLAMLDRCSAFDDAVVLLQDRDPMRNRGAFGELAVTGRQWSAAKGLSGDFVAIDSRLDQIRLRVELLLAGPVRPQN